MVVMEVEARVVPVAVAHAREIVSCDEPVQVTRASPGRGA